MTTAEENFSLQWGILSIFGTTPFTADSWGAFADQGPYLSFGETPFVHPPFPMWAMVAWTNLTSQTLPNTRMLSAILAMLALFSSYFIAKRFLKVEHAIYAPGFLAGSLMWNDSARHASPEIWGITFVLMSLALTLSMIFSRHNSLLSSLLMSFGLFLSVMILMLSSFAGIALFLTVCCIALVMFRPQLQTNILLISSVVLGCLGGLSWYWTMDFPVLSQIVDTIALSEYIPHGLGLNTLIIDFALLPFFISGLIIGFRKLFTQEYSQMFVFLIAWFVISYGIFGFSTMIIPPFAFVALMGLLSANLSIQSLRLRWILIAYAMILSAFGIAPRLVDAMGNGLFNQTWTAIGIIPLLLLIAIPLSTFLMSKDALSKLTFTAMSRALITLVIAALIKVAFANLLGKTRIAPEQLVRNEMHVIQSFQV